MFSSERFSLLAATLGVLALGVIFVLADEKIESHTSQFWGEFVRDLGIALVIASVVALAFERYLRERLYSQIEERIGGILDRFRSEAVDSFDLQKLPLEILAVVRTEILAAKVIDRDIHCHYEFTEHDDGPTFKAVVTICFLMENLTRNWETVQLHETGIYQDPDNPDDAGFIEIVMKHVSGEHEAPFDATGSEIKSLIRHKGRQQVLARTIELGPQAQVNVKTIEIAYFDLDDNDYFSPDRLTIGMKVSLSIPGAKYTARAEPDDILVNHLRTSTSEPQASGNYEWGFERALLPGQGILMEWGPRDSPL